MIAGALGSVCGGLFYQDFDRPLYYRGHGTSLAVMSMGLIAVLVLRFYLQYQNSARDRLQTLHKYITENSDGDDSPLHESFKRASVNFELDGAQSTDKDISFRYNL